MPKLPYNLKLLVAQILEDVLYLSPHNIEVIDRASTAKANN